MEDFGILIQVTDHIKALCPSLHMSDITLKHPEKKFKEVNKIKCRVCMIEFYFLVFIWLRCLYYLQYCYLNEQVLTVNAKRKRLILTHKKSLVQSPHAIITSYDDIQDNIAAHGYISSVRSNGCIITFYNNVHGFVHKRNLR